MQQVDVLTVTLQDWVAVFMRRSMRNFIHYIRERGLSMSQIGALFYLHRKGTCGVTDLAEYLGVTSAAASQLLDRLVQWEFILRSEDPADRRLKKLVLTEKGLRTIQESIHARQGWLEDLATTLTPSEKEQVVGALSILIDKAKQIKNPVDSEI